VLANLALILLGWVFLSRWSGVGTLYFIITALYALLQLPARVALDLKDFFEHHLVEASSVNLEPVFYLLAVGKIFLIGGFMLLVRKVTDDIAEPRAWPKGPRKSPYPVRDAVLALIFAFIAPLVIDWGRQAVAGMLP
jgi:Ca2+/Na+ antiporter